MEPFFKKIAEKLKVVRKEDYLYFSVLAVFFLLVLYVFSVSSSFLTANINKVFSSNESKTVHALDMEQYSLVAKKLRFSVQTPEAINSTSTASSTPQTQESEDKPFDKQSLVIKVLNATAKKGLASNLAELLSKDGFIVTKTGNEEKDYATTTIYLLESKSAYRASLLETVRKSYPAVIATTTDKNGGYDAVIIIGDR